jgi:GNAT superfamily N-acetyltransferase
MIKVKKQDLSKIAHMYTHIFDTVILTCLQGYMGEAYVDDIENPKGVILHCGSFVFIEGNKIEDDLLKFISNILNESGLNELIIISKVESIGELLEKAYGSKVTNEQRYAIEKKEEEFDLEKLQSYVNNLSPQYELHKINEQLYYECTKEEWSLDFISNFDSANDFLDRGIGFVILHNGKIISGASSYTIYDEGIEIEIATRKEYRKLGLALVVGAALILECRKQGRYPSWDAANMASVQLATKLGYRYLGPYDTYCIEK